MKALAPRTLVAAAAALAVATSAPLTAEAAGQLSVNIAPSNAQDAQMLRLGLALYALHADIQTNGHVTQRGANNAAGIAQGSTDRAIIHQEGAGHTGTIEQTGGNNAYGLFQFGQNTDAQITQTGGQAGLTLQFGW